MIITPGRVAVAAAVVFASVVASAAGRQDEGKKSDPAVAPPTPAPSAVQEVQVKPVATPAGPAVEVVVRQGGRKLVDAGIRKPTALAAPAPDGPRRNVVRLDVKTLEDDQKRYERDLKAAKGAVVDFAGRTRQTVPEVKDFADWKPALFAGDEARTLPPYVGSPVLDPALKDRLIRKSLMITDLKVVNDPVRTTGMGKWTFGHLMTEMANPKATGIDPADFTRRWLAHWEADQTVNGLPVRNRKDGVRNLVIDPWQAASGGPGRPLDLAKAPFRLMAIVNRVDLSDNLVLGAERIGDGGAGEARFVFCVLDTRTEKDLDKARPTLFTVIFEYGIKKRDMLGVREWVDAWYGLSDPALDADQAEYNRRLEAVTEQFARADADPESPPNRSAIAQIRTNEIELDFAGGPSDPAAGPLWELREFVVNTHDDGHLYQVTVKQTPDFTQNNLPRIADYLNHPDHRAAILDERHRVPVQFPPGRPFVDGGSRTPLDFFWNVPHGSVRDLRTRHLFSLGTCSGCHAAEAFPKGNAGNHFTHLFPLTRAKNSEVQMSSFLTGKEKKLPEMTDTAVDFELPDPAGQTGRNGQVVKRRFGDLDRRAHNLRNLHEYFSYYLSFRPPLQNVH